MTYKLHDMEKIRKAQGNLHFVIPVKQEPTDLCENDTPKASFEIFDKYANFHLNEPLGPVDTSNTIKFNIERTHKGNLPVYTQMKMGGQQKRTLIRGISGDIEDFKQELSKIVSNAPITEKTGKVEVNGIHSAKVKLWLTRLGF